VLEMLCDLKADTARWC